MTPRTALIARLGEAAGRRRQAPAVPGQRGPVALRLDPAAIPAPIPAFGPHTAPCGPQSKEVAHG